MELIKKYLKPTITTILIIILFIIIFSSLYYFNLIDKFTYEIIIIITLLLNIFFQTFILGKKCIKKGYLEGIKFNTIIITLFTIINLLSIKDFNIKTLLYYLIMYLTSILGGCYGISKQQKKKNN